MGLAAASVHAVSDPSENVSPFSNSSSSSSDENGTDGPVHSGTLRHNFEVAQWIAHQSVWCDSVVFLESWCDSVVFLDCSVRASGVVVRDSWGGGVPLVFLECSAKASSIELAKPKCPCTSWRGCVGDPASGKTGAESVLSSVISPQSTSGQKMPQNFPAAE